MSNVAIKDVFYDSATSKYRYKFGSNEMDLVNRNLKMKTPFREEKRNSGDCLMSEGIFQEFTVKSCTGSTASNIMCSLVPVKYSNSCGTVYGNRTATVSNIMKGYWW